MRAGYCRLLLTRATGGVKFLSRSFTTHKEVLTVEAIFPITVTLTLIVGIFLSIEKANKNVKAGTAWWQKRTP